MRRFDERVLALMAHDVDVPLALSNLAARAQVSAAHIHITRHLARDGSRLTELAERAGMTKQAMGDAGRPVRGLGPGDARARPARCARAPRAVHRRRPGLAGGLPDAVAQAETEFRAERRRRDRHRGNHRSRSLCGGLEFAAGSRWTAACAERPHIWRARHADPDCGRRPGAGRRPAAQPAHLRRGRRPRGDRHRRPTPR